MPVQGILSIELESMILAYQISVNVVRIVILIASGRWVRFQWFEMLQKSL